MVLFQSLFYLFLCGLKNTTILGPVIFVILTNLKKHHHLEDSLVSPKHHILIPNCVVLPDSQLEYNMMDHLGDQDAQVLVQKDCNTEFELCLEA